MRTISERSNLARANAAAARGALEQFAARAHVSADELRLWIRQAKVDGR